MILETNEILDNVRVRTNPQFDERDCIRYLDNVRVRTNYMSERMNKEVQDAR